MSALDAILEYQDADFVSKAFAAPVREQAWSPLLRDAGFSSFLAEHNGLYAFDRALHIFGVDPARPFHDLTLRNGADSEWRRIYGDGIKNIWFFAEDAFGHLSGLRGEEAVSFDPESGEVEIVGRGFEGWLLFVEDDANFATGQGLAQVWSEDKGAIPFGSRLSPKMPFVLDGEFDIDNLRPLPWAENLDVMGRVYLKIKDLPEGAAIP